MEKTILNIKSIQIFLRHYNKLRDNKIAYLLSSALIYWCVFYRKDKILLVLQSSGTYLREKHNKYF